MTHITWNENSWDEKSIETLLEKPFFDLINEAYSVHKKHFPIPEMEFCSLLSIKTGGCPENCAYCPQSAHYKTDVKREKLMNHEDIIFSAKQAKEMGAKRFCMGGAYRSPPKNDFQKILEVIKEVKDLGLETCVTLGMLDEEQSQQLKEAGLDFYNHNLDTSPEYYEKIITTRNYQDRIDTIQNIINAGINVCCGGILGMGESRLDRIRLLLQLKQLPQEPQSIPINKLMTVKGTPLEKEEPLDIFEFVKTIAATRILFPTSMVRLSAGREDMTPEAQAWCFMAGANSIFIGEKLLTENNPKLNDDIHLLKKLGLETPCYQN